MNDCVILLHGLARSKRSMNKIARHLDRLDYQVFNIGYPSTRFRIETLSENTITPALNLCRGYSSNKIHFVTHSMGGILIRYFLNHHKIPELGRIVMLSPPNKGSEIVNKLGRLWLFKAINGPAGNQLGADRDSLPSTLKPIESEIGIITGNKALNPLLSRIIPGESDGKVSLNSAKLEGMKDFLVVPHSHSFIMQSSLVCEQISYFLRYGYFKK